METVRVSLKSKQFVNRGFANGPYCPIYGFGMSFVIVFLSGFKNNIPLLFVLGMLLTTALEYFTAYLLEVIFKAKWWDYSYKKFNFQGRICLDISVAWGVLSVIMIELVVPFIDKVVDKIPLMAGKIFIVMVLVLMAADVAATAKSILSFKKVLYRLEAVRAEIREEWDKFSDKFEENVREYIEESDLAERVAVFNLKKEELKERLEQHKHLIKDMSLEDFKAKFKDKDFNEEKIAALNKIRNMYARYAAIRKVHVSHIHRRILKAYPGFKPNNAEIQEIFKNLKENLKRRK